MQIILERCNQLIILQFPRKFVAFFEERKEIQSDQFFQNQMNMISFGLGKFNKQFNPILKE